MVFLLSDFLRLTNRFLDNSIRVLIIFNYVIEFLTNGECYKIIKYVNRVLAISETKIVDGYITVPFLQD